MFEKFFRNKESQEFNDNIFSKEGLEKLKSLAVDKNVSDDKIFDALFQLASRESFLLENKNLVETVLHFIWLHRPNLRSQLKEFKDFNLPE